LLPGQRYRFDAGLPGGTINLSTVGMLCDLGWSTGPQGYNGTYFITGGVKKNLNATGTGNVSASMETSNRLILSIFGVFQR
jgi:hypothetical protein